ncbi:MAG: Rho termination factor N-terminal domain-containing protein [Nitrospira sp.]|nr:Rho termination factor N-terminal domain-containing protein [Nitrospira sp.]
MRDINQEMEGMSLDELRILAKRLGLSGYSGLRKADLIKNIQESDATALQKQLFPTWWQTYHNHVYGSMSVVGLVLTVLFFVWPAGTVPVAKPTAHLNLPIRTVEKPISFSDYAAMPPAEKEALFKHRIGQQFVWEGFLSDTIGFELGLLEEVPEDKPISIQIKPTQSSSPQIFAECQFGEIGGGDSGVLLAVHLKTLTIGQRLRISGVLDGMAESPILKAANMEAFFPIGE